MQTWRTLSRLLVLCVASLAVACGGDAEDEGAQAGTQAASTSSDEPFERCDDRMRQMERAGQTEDCASGGRATANNQCTDARYAVCLSNGDTQWCDTDAVPYGDPVRGGCRQSMRTSD